MKAAPCEVVDRGVGFSEVQAGPAHVGVEFSQCASAPLAGFASVHDDVRVCTQKLQTSDLCLQKVGPVDSRIFHWIEGAGTNDAFGVIQWDARNLKRIFNDMERFVEL